MEKLFIAQEREAWSILLALPVFTSATANVKHVLGCDFETIYLGYKDKRTIVVGDERTFEKLERTGIKKVKKDSQTVKKIIQIFKKEAKTFNKITKEIFEADLTKKTNKELLLAYKKYYNQYYKLFPYGEPITWSLRFGFVKEIEKEIKNKKKINESVAVLITSENPSFVNKEEIAILKLIIDIKKNKQLIELFKKPLAKINQKLISDFPEINKLIDAHTKEYCWIPYDNGSVLWNKNHFIAVIKNHVLKKIDANEKLKKLESFSESVVANKEKIIKELNLNKKTIQLFEAVADAGYLLDLKKEKTSKSHYHMIPWFEEVAKRLNISVKQLEYMIPEELEDALLNNLVDKSLLDERRVYCVLKIDKGKVSFYYKNDAKKLFSKFKINISDKTTEIQGVCAQPGTIRGIAKVIISAKDIRNMKENEILITSMTTPEYVPAMKKAKGIVTDEGGITCHAAIVAREIGVPCIVGTKIATRFFKNGEIIEMHAANGIVRKLGDIK